MPQTSTQELTQMLIQLSEGRTQIVDDILPLIYDKLRIFPASGRIGRIMVDYARKHHAEKRGGDAEKLPLEEEILIVSEGKSAELLALDEALENLAKIDPQKSKIVELRYFGGLSVEETAEVLGVSEITVKRHWRMAKAWLYGQLANDNSHNQ